MFVIPSIDIKDGRVVRIVQGDPNREIISIDDPISVAQKWKDMGAKLIHIVDIDAAHDKQPQKKLIDQILKIGVKCTVGGGIRDRETASSYIRNGAWAVVVSTIIEEDPKEFMEIIKQFPQNVIVALDFDINFNLMIRGWKTTVRKNILSLDIPVEKILFTATFTDGTGMGIPREHFKKITEKFKNKLKIASGGIYSSEDLIFLKSLGFWGAIVGRAFYEGKINIFEI